MTLTEGTVLGGGAFSRVSIVTEETTGRQYALKRMRKSAVVQCPEHVFCEQTITRNTAHPFCIRQYGSFQVSSCLGTCLVACAVANACCCLRRICCARDLGDGTVDRQSLSFGLHVFVVMVDTASSCPEAQRHNARSDRQPAV